MKPKEFNWDWISHLYIESETLINNDIENLKELNKHSLSYYDFLWSLADNYYDRGILAYLLNKMEDAQKNFSSACEYHSVLNNSTPWGLKFTSVSGGVSKIWVESAIFSRSKDLKNRCSMELLNKIVYPKEKEINPLFYELLSLCYYFKGDEKRAVDQIIQIQEHEERCVKNRDWVGDGKYVGRAKMIDGIINENKGLLLEGMKVAITKYARINRKPPIPLCTTALKYLFLAKERGIIFNEDDLPQKLKKFVFRFF